jgi:hypothetical protein
MLIYIMNSSYCLSVWECKEGVWEINIITCFMLIYSKNSGYYMTVSVGKLSVWEIKLITGFYFNL